MPADRDALEKLPGVGRKTANVVMNVAFGQETFAVDTHVFRVSNRTGLAPGKTPLAVEAKLEKVTPPPYRREAHHLLILHGRYVCTARIPACPKCIIKDLCEYPYKTAPKATQGGKLPSRPAAGESFLVNNPGRSSPRSRKSPLRSIARRRKPPKAMAD